MHGLIRTFVFMLSRKPSRRPSRWRTRPNEEQLELRLVLSETPVGTATSLAGNTGSLEEFMKENAIVTRDEWGARPPVGTAEPPGDFTTVVIHHSGNSGETDPKKIQQQHMDQKKFDDVGYHFMIDPRGTIYEGRSLDSKGSHVENANTGKIGILLMGDFQPSLFDFTDDTPTPEQLNRAVELIEALKDRYPTITTLGGHKDFKPTTECPGDDLYKLLPTLRDETELNPPPPPAPPVTPAPPPPLTLPATIFGPIFDPKMGA